LPENDNYNYTDGLKIIRKKEDLDIWITRKTIAWYKKMIVMQEQYCGNYKDNMKNIILIFNFLFFFSCYNKFEIKEIKDDLFVDKSGNFLFITIDNTISDNPKSKFITKIYLKGNEPAIDLKKVIDTASFIKINSTYYKDKNHLYFFNKTLDGGTLSSLNSYDSIKFINSWKIKR
jgi:hypothetical protein